MELFQLVEGLQNLSPNAQLLFVACSFIVVMYLITLMAFYPDAARRIKGIVKEWQHWQGNKRTDNKHRKGGE